MPLSLPCHGLSVSCVVSYLQNITHFPHSSELDTLASRTFHTPASPAVYSLSIEQQCIYLGSKLGTNATTSILNNIDNPKANPESAYSLVQERLMLKVDTY